MKNKFIAVMLSFLTFLWYMPNITVLANSVRPKVSIIIPVYNEEQYLRKCMDSVVNQTLKDIEIICVDDGSTDKSLEILQEYKSNDPRIRVIVQKNSGAYVARNQGLNIAKGEYIGFIDTDDYIDLNTYEKAYETAKNSDSDIVVFGGSTFGKIEEWADKELTTPNLTYVNNSIDALLNTNGARLQVWNKIYRKSILDENSIKFRTGRIGLDTVFNFRVFPVAKKITFISDKFYHWRKGVSQSISDTKWADISIRYQALIDLFKFSCEDWRNFNYIKGNELNLLKYASRKFGFYPKINSPKRNYFCKQLVDILGKDIFNDENIKKLPKDVQNRLNTINNCAKQYNL